MNELLSTSEIEELERLEKEATPMPWSFKGHTKDPDIYDAKGWWIVNQVCSGVGDNDDSGEINARCIVAMRNNFSRLLETVKQLRSDLEELS